MRHRVVVWGTGNVGKPAIRAVLANENLDLVGVIVSSPAKAGQDAGDLAGVPRTGVATIDVEHALATNPDAVVYAATGDTRPGDAIDDVLRCLVAGANVVTTAIYPLLHPPSAPAELRERFLTACRAGGGTSMGGNTCSTKCAARSAIRRPPQEGQKPRPLQLNGTSRSNAPVAAAHPGEAVRQHPAAEELSELRDDERRQARAIRPRVHAGEDVGKVRADDAVEHAGRPRARHVDPGHAAGQERA